MKIGLRFLLLGSLLAFVTARGDPSASVAPNGPITLEVVPFPPYHAAGNDVPTTLRLKRGRDPLTWQDLAVTHAEKIHLLIIDESLTDYRHQHPSPMDIPGDYRFVLRSKYGGKYFVWAEVVSKATGKTELVKGTVAVEGRPKPLEQIMNSTATDDGYRYELSFDGGRELAAGQSARLKVTVTKPDGAPADNLEPMMGAFGALAAFSGDLESAILSFTDNAPLGEAPRGGPQLSFEVTPPSPGYWRLFVQTKVNGLTRVGRFGVNVGLPPGS